MSGGDRESASALRLLTEPFRGHPDIEALIKRFPEAEKSAEWLQQEKFRAFGEAIARLAVKGFAHKGDMLLFSGPMRSGKSHLGLAVAEFYGQNVGSSVRFVKPSVDKRDPTMTSHNRCASLACSAVEDLSNDELLSDDFLVIDEYQFLALEQRTRVDAMVRLRAAQGKHSIVCMLDQDFRGKEWENYGVAKSMVAELDGRHFGLHSICEDCGGIAGQTQREVHVEADVWRPARFDEPIVSVEGAASERYTARCADCHEVAPARVDVVEI